jgi:hypothetical protein
MTTNGASANGKAVAPDCRNRRDELQRVSARAKHLVDGHARGPPSSAHHEAVADDGGILFSGAQDSGRECRMVGASEKPCGSKAKPADWR